MRWKLFCVIFALFVSVMLIACRYSMQRSSYKGSKCAQVASDQRHACRMSTWKLFRWWWWSRPATLWPIYVTLISSCVCARHRRWSWQVTTQPPPSFLLIFVKRYNSLIIYIYILPKELRKLREIYSGHIYIHSLLWKNLLRFIWGNTFCLIHSSYLIIIMKRMILDHS